MQTDCDNPGPPPYYIEWNMIMLIVSSLVVAGVLIYAFATAGSGAPLC